MEQAKGFTRTIATSQDPNLVRSFRGHQKTINSVAFHPNMFQLFIRKQLVSGGADALVKVWDFRPNIRPFRFVGHKGNVNDVAFTSDGNIIISAGQDRQIRFWKNSVQGKCSTIKAHSGPILKISMFPDNTHLISCSMDKTIKLWSLAGKFRTSFISHTNWVRECQMSPDQRIFVSCSDDKTVKLWDMQTSNVIHTFTDHKQKVLTCQFSPDGTSVAAGSENGTIKLWDIRSNKLFQHYNAHIGQINRISFHPYGFHMTSVSKEGKIKIWNLKEGRLGWTLFGHSGEIKSINFNKKGDYFATGGVDNLVLVWKTCYDESIGAPNRAQQKNFIKNQQNQIQPLWKSNKLINNINEKHLAKEITSIEVAGEQFNYHPLSEYMANGLQKLVNQMDKITNSLNSLDQRMIANQQLVEQLMQHDQVIELIQNMQQKKVGKQLYHSVWQQFRKKQLQQLQKSFLIEKNKQKEQQFLRNLQLNEQIQQQQRKDIYLKQQQMQFMIDEIEELKNEDMQDTLKFIQ